MSTTPADDQPDLPKTSDQLDDRDKEQDAAAQEQDEQPGRTDETVAAPIAITPQGAVAQPSSEKS